MPFNRALYPENWEEISAAIRERAGNKCETCGVPNHAVGARDRLGAWHDQKFIDSMRSESDLRLFKHKAPFLIKIVLTVGHLDQNPGNNDPANLRCMCQRCHLNFDRSFNLKKRRVTWQRKWEERIAATGQLGLGI